MKKKLIALGCAAMFGVTSLAGCETSAETESTSTESTVTESTAIETESVSVVPESKEPETTEYQPVTIENYNREVTFEEKPEKIVALTLNSAEIIAALGEADSIVAIQAGSNTVDDILPEYQETLAKCDFPESINSGIPTLEGMLSIAPDLVVCNCYYFYAEQIFGSMDDYSDNGVQFYITEGSYVENCSIENTYNDIRNIGAILNESEKADELVEDMKARLSAVEEKVQNIEKKKVMVYDSVSEDSYFVAGGSGLLNELIEKAGAENVFNDIDDDYPSVNLEEIIARNPDCIVILSYTSEDPNEGQNKADALLNMEELSEVPAIKNNNIIVVPWFQGSPSLQNVDFVENLAATLYPEAFN